MGSPESGGYYGELQQEVGFLLKWTGLCFGIFKLGTRKLAGLSFPIVRDFTLFGVCS